MAEIRWKICVYNRVDFHLLVWRIDCLRAQFFERKKNESSKWMIIIHWFSVKEKINYEDVNHSIISWPNLILFKCLRFPWYLSLKTNFEILLKNTVMNGSRVLEFISEEKTRIHLKMPFHFSHLDLEKRLFQIIMEVSFEILNCESYLQRWKLSFLNCLFLFDFSTCTYRNVPESVTAFNYYKCVRLEQKEQ